MAAIDKKVSQLDAKTSYNSTDLLLISESATNGDTTYIASKSIPMSALESRIIDEVLARISNKFVHKEDNVNEDVTGKKTFTAIPDVSSATIEPSADKDLTTKKYVVNNFVSKNTIATTDTVGLVKIGNNLTITGDGTLNAQNQQTQVEVQQAVTSVNGTKIATIKVNGDPKYIYAPTKTIVNVESKNVVQANGKTKVAEITVDGTKYPINVPTVSKTNVVVTKDYTSGTKIATINVDNTPTELFIPDEKSITVTSDYNSTNGLKIGSINVAGVTTNLYAPHQQTLVNVVTNVIDGVKLATITANGRSYDIMMPSTTSGVSLVEFTGDSSYWCKVYSNNWCEQGGKATCLNSNNRWTICLGRSYESANYHVLATVIQKKNGDCGALYGSVVSMQKNSFEIQGCSSHAVCCFWEAKGFLA